MLLAVEVAWESVALVAAVSGCMTGIVVTFLKFLERSKTTNGAGEKVAVLELIRGTAQNAQANALAIGELTADVGNLTKDVAVLTERIGVIQNDVATIKRKMEDRGC